MQRDTLFIGHANPEDNEFTLWLQAKLINEGYKSECDLSYLIGGEEDYWKNLQSILENNSAKYLLVLSYSTFTKQGVIDEWEQVKSIARKNRLEDFIYVLKIDEVPFDVRIGVNTKNHFRFDKSWANGLKNLFIKLNKDSVPKNQTTPFSIDSWSKNRYSTFSGILDKREVYYSNWLKIENLPETIYFFKYHNDTQSKTIEKEVLEFPIIRHDNYIISFSDSLPKQFDHYDFEIPCIKRIDILTKNANAKYQSEEFPTYEDLKRFLVRLLKEAWFMFLADRKLVFVELSGKNKCFYYLKDQLFKDKIHFDYNNKKTYKQLVGEYGEAYWHYGLSTSILLEPIICFSLRAHLVFSDDGIVLWSNKAKMHKARRSKGKSFFNKEWRSLQLGFLASLSDDLLNIKVPITRTETLNLPISTVKFYCEFGYDEPKNDGRLIPLDYYEEIDEEDLDEIEESQIDIVEDGE